VYIISWEKDTTSVLTYLRVHASEESERELSSEQRTSIKDGTGPNKKQETNY
jgi:hypothetical protein